MDAADADEATHLTRNGLERWTAEELVEHHKRMSRVDAAAIRREADEFFGEDRVDDHIR